MHAIASGDLARLHDAGPGRPLQRGRRSIDADMSIPADATGMVLFVHGSGSSRHSPRNQFVAGHLHAQATRHGADGFADSHEERADQFSGHLRFDIRISRAACHGCRRRTDRGQNSLPLGLFGASTGAAAALVVAAAQPESLRAVVSRGGRPDLAGHALAAVQSPTLLIVGSEDREVLELNRKADGAHES